MSAHFLFFFSNIRTPFANGNIGKHTPSEKEKTQLTQNLHGNGLSFTPNKGQIADMNGKLCRDILYKGDGGGADIYLRKTGISYVYNNMSEIMHEIDERVEELIKAGTLTEAGEKEKKDELIHKESIKIHRVDMDFEGANQNARRSNEDEVEGYNNYYYTHCHSGVLNVKQYNKVTYKNIYDGIDVSYYGSKAQGIKYDLIVQPHADPNQIKLHWKGAESIHINQEGNLVIKTSVNEFYESIPKVYQIINGNIVDVKTKYVLTPISKDKAIINFSFSIYDSSLHLVIDPWATYLGGSSRDDYGADITTDNAGNTVVTGYTRSTDFPVIAGYQMFWGAGFNNAFDAFVVKFNPAGICLWSTFYGGDQEDMGQDIATDNLGNVVITGRTTSANFPIGQISANVIFQPILGGSYDAFVVKFSATGTRQWATYYGGSNGDYGNGIATDQAGNIVITGHTRSSNFPILPAVGYTQPFGGIQDAFILKFDISGTRQWATYYGGSSPDFGSSIATDAAGNIVITGYTGSINFPVGFCCANVVQQSISGGGAVFSGGDAFIVKFNSSGMRQWATYFGGSGNDYGWSIATDQSGNVVVAGSSTSANFPIGFCCSNIVQQSGYGGGTTFWYGDAFVVKFDPSGKRLWATFYGGINDDIGIGIATDRNNNIYLVMEIEDAAGPNLIDACSLQPIFNGGSSTNVPGNHTAIEDQIIVKFNPVGKKICATYIGGTGEDDMDGPGSGKGGGIAIYDNSIYITGFTDGGYPVTSGAFQTTFSGGGTFPGGVWDAFVASLCTNICEAKALDLSFTAATNVCANSPVTFTPTVTNSCDTTGYKYHWTFTGGTPASSDSVKPTVTFSGIGAHDVKLVVTTPCKKDSITKYNYITINSCTVCNLVGQYTKGTANCTGCGCKEWIMVTATGGTSPFTYLWPDGYINRYKNQLCPGTYTINVKDNNNCSINISVTTP